VAEAALFETFLKLLDIKTEGLGKSQCGQILKPHDSLGSKARHYGE
jgi:hypothetical protein